MGEILSAYRGISGFIFNLYRCVMRGCDFKSKLYLRAIIVDVCAILWAFSSLVLLGFISSELFLIDSSTAASKLYFHTLKNIDYRQCNFEGGNPMQMSTVR